VQSAPTLDIGRFVQSGCRRPLSDADRAGYDAPFPDESFKAGPRAMPGLVPYRPDDPASAANRSAWQALAASTTPMLVAFSDSDPITGGMRPILERTLPGAECRALPPGGRRPGARCRGRRVRAQHSSPVAVARPRSLTETRPMIIFGFRSYAKLLAMLTFVCANCRNPAAHRVVQYTRKFTLFFLPLFPISRRRAMTCTFCGTSTRLTREQADQLVGGAAGGGAVAGAPAQPAGRPPIG
jgi:hypothetical protein